MNSNNKIKVTIEYTEPKTNERKTRFLEADVVIMQGLTYGTEEDKRRKCSTAIVGEASINTILSMFKALASSIVDNATHHLNKLK